MKIESGPFTYTSGHAPVPLTEAEEKSEQERVRKLSETWAKKPPTFGKGGGVNLMNTILSVAETTACPPVIM